MSKHRAMLWGALAASAMLVPTKLAHAVANSEAQPVCPDGQTEGPKGCAYNEGKVTAAMPPLGDWPSGLFINWGGRWVSDYTSYATAGITSQTIPWRRGEVVQEDPCKQGTNSQPTAAQPTSAKPVNILTGQKILPESDLEFAGQGIQLRVTRSYIKGMSRVGVFGKKWTSSLDYSLVFEYQDLTCWTKLDRIVACDNAGKPLTALLAYNPSGYPVRFTDADGDGTWTTARGDQLSKSGGVWTLQHASGSRTTFDVNGRPLTIKDERGVGLSYTYNATTS